MNTFGLFLLLATSPVLVIADDNEDPTPTASDWLTSWYVITLFFVVMYFIIAALSFPMVRYRTGIPVLFIALILIFPPSFFFLLFYLMILRIGFFSTWWYIQSSETRISEVNVVTEPSSGVRSQRERNAVVNVA